MPKLARKDGILQVAKLAGVSQMTVTRAFSGAAPVAEKTRAAVLAAALELGYKPDPFARALRGCGTRSIGLIWGLGGPHSSVGIVRDMAWELHKAGYAVYINDSLSDPEAIRNVLSDYVARRVDGVILSVRFMELLQAPGVRELLERIPALVIESPEDHDIPCDKVILDYYRVMDDIVDHFVRSGRRKPVAISDYPSVRPRLEVFRKRLEVHGLDTTDFFIQRDAPESILLGQAFVNGLTGKYPDGKYPFDAIWTSCDEAAAALVAHLNQKGYRVPEDIAVIGFNNNETSEYFSPPLASVERMNDKLRTAIISMLLARIAQPQGKHRQETIHMEFVHRRSAG